MSSSSYSTNPITKQKEPGVLSTIRSIDDLAAQAPTTANTSRSPSRRSYGGLGAGIAALATMAYLGATQPVKAETALTWNIATQDPVIFNFDTTTLQNEMLLVYNVQNLTDPTLGSGANITKVTINAGQAQGVYSATAPNPEEWTIDMSDPYKTVFILNPGYSGIAPGAPVEFDLYTTQLGNPQQGSATAQSALYGAFQNPNNQPWVPVPEPTTSTLALVGAAALLRKKVSKICDIAKRNLNTGVGWIHDTYNKSW